MGVEPLILLDTHAWIWWIDGSTELSQRARDAIDAGTRDGSVAVSAISCWEIAMLVHKGRLELATPAADWIARCEALPFFEVIPVDSRIAVGAAELPAKHEDAADRVIVATAFHLGAPVVTKDRRLAAYDVRAIW